MRLNLIRIIRLWWICLRTNQRIIRGGKSNPAKSRMLLLFRLKEFLKEVVINPQRFWDRDNKVNTLRLLISPFKKRLLILLINMPCNSEVTSNRKKTLWMKSCLRWTVKSLKTCEGCRVVKEPTRIRRLKTHSWLHLKLNWETCFLTSRLSWFKTLIS